MSFFNSYSSITDAGSMPAASPPANGVRVDLPKTNYNDGFFQCLTVRLDENNYQLQENNKWLKKFCKQQKKKGKHKKSFLHKVGDAFCKALPAILTTVTSAVVSVLFKTPSNKKALHAA